LFRSRVSSLPLGDPAQDALLGERQKTVQVLVELSRELGAPEHDYAILAEGNTSAPIDDKSFLLKAITRYKVGDRFLVQTDYRWLPTASSNAAFGYNFCR
jgi:hypothetical protein